jgi:hypothetical protein
MLVVVDVTAAFDVVVVAAAAAVVVVVVAFFRLRVPDADILSHFPSTMSDDDALALLRLVQALLSEKLLVSADMLASFLPNATQHDNAVANLMCEIYITRGDIASARSQRKIKKRKKKYFL